MNGKPWDGSMAQLIEASEAAADSDRAVKVRRPGRPEFVEPSLEELRGIIRTTGAALDEFADNMETSDIPPKTPLDSPPDPGQDTGMK